MYKGFKFHPLSHIIVTLVLIMTFWPRTPGLHQVIGSIYWVILFDFRYLCNFAPNKPNTFEEIFFVKPQTLEKRMSNIFAIQPFRSFDCC